MTAKPETNSKIFALRAAQWVGCTGAHKHDGKWMPCETHEELERISNAAEPDKKSGYQEMNERYFKRRAKGKNKKRGWEKLRETKPLGGFATLEGGGIVSAPINSTIYSGGVKSYIPGISPRDNDPDVFVDIESARKRSRMLGCIGVRRMPSATGRTVWLPCTNNSDYARLAGTTFLGRRNQRESQNRMIRTIIRRELRNSSKNKLRNKSLFEEIYGTKGLGRAIGRALTPNVSSRGLRQSLQRIEGVLDPFKRRDMDRDGMIFDGTWREMVAPTRGGLSSETDGIDEVKPRWASPVRNNWFTPNKVKKGGVLKAQDILNFDRLRLRKNRDEQASVLGVTREVIDAMHKPDASIDAFDADRLVMSALNLHPMLIFGDAWLIADKTPSQPKTRNVGKLDDRDNRILEIRANGGKVKDIADELKVSKQRASQLLKRALERNERDLDSRGLSSSTINENDAVFLPIKNLAAARDPKTDTNLQTPANQEFQSKRRAARKSRGTKVGNEIIAPLELQLAIVEDYKDTKKTLAFIAKKHNVTVDYVSLLARQFNLPYRKNIRQNLTGVQQANIVEAIKTGMPDREIRKKFNITKSQLARLKYISETARERELRLSDKKIRREKTNEEIIKLFNEGLRITDIAKRTETDFNYVGDLLLANTETREKLIARRDGSDLIPQVRELFKNGLNMLEIRNKLRKDMKTIRKIINEDEELSKLQQERIRKRQNLQSIATELREFLLSGESYDAAMKKFNLSRTQIKNFVQKDRKKTKKQGETADRLRLPDRRSTRIVLPYKTERDNEIVKLYKQGTSRAELMQMFTITPSRLSQILKKQPGIPRLPDDGRGGARTRGLSSSTANPMKRGDGMIQRDERGNPIRQADRRKETVENSIAKLKKLGLSDEEINLLFTGDKATPVDPKTPDVDVNAAKRNATAEAGPPRRGLSSMSLSEMAKSSPSTWPEKQKIHFIDWANSKPSFNVPYALAQKFKRDGDLTDVEWQRILNFYSKYGPEKRGLSSSTTPNATNLSNVGARRMGQIILDRVRQDRRNKKPGTRVHYHVVGPGAVGKSTLTDYLVKNGLMPPDSDAAHIDPDFIKQGIIGYDGGKGSVSVHRESARSATKTVESAAKEGMDIVTEGTGYRLYEYKTTSDPSYKKVVHIPFLPYDKAEARLAARNAKGGRQLPIDQIRLKGQQMYGWLTNHLNKNEIQDMYIWDMDVPEGAAPRVIAKIEDGVFRAIDEPAFKRWSEQSGGGRGGDSNLSWFKRNFPQK